MYHHIKTLMYTVLLNGAVYRDLTCLAAQKVEHYEIASYGTARGLARQLGELESARLLSHTLGEEESADFKLTAISDPLLQQATLDDMGAEVNLDTEERRPPQRKRKQPVKSGAA